MVYTSIGTNKYDCVSGATWQFSCLPPLSLVHQLSEMSREEVGLCQRVGHCNVPRDTSSGPSWYECDIIGPLLLLLLY